jgi:hypothetical protein
MSAVALGITSRDAAIPDDITGARWSVPFRARRYAAPATWSRLAKLLDSWWPDVALVDAIFPKMRYVPPSFQVGSFLDLVGGHMHLVFPTAANHHRERARTIRPNGSKKSARG